MADIVASTEGSDVLRLSALFNGILGEEKNPLVPASTAAV